MGSAAASWATTPAMHGMERLFSLPGRILVTDRSLRMKLAATLGPLRSSLTKQMKRPRMFRGLFFRGHPVEAGWNIDFMTYCLLYDITIHLCHIYRGMA